jgi:hypothetical protein
MILQQRYEKSENDSNSNEKAWEKAWKRRKKVRGIDSPIQHSSKIGAAHCAPAL